jgi:predicted AAA+ superfamily ATPase
MDYIDRTIARTLTQNAREYPVVTLTGPRQAGKTTLARHEFPTYRYVNLELPEARELALHDPRSFFEHYSPPVIIDEIQRVPELLSYIQVDVDEHRDENGRYILTGSEQLDLRAKVSQTLAGRTALLQILPLSCFELNRAGVTLDRDDYLYRGFMPGIYRSNLNPTSFYRNYYQTYVERDVRQLISIRNASAFEVFLKLLAGRVGQLINLSDLSGATGVSSTTLGEWLSVLEASFIVFRLRPYYKNFGKRLVKSSKIYFTEPGLAAYLLGIREPDQVATHPLLGGLFENLVVAEAMKAKLNKGEDSNLFFFRDNNRLEVDLLVDNGQNLVPIEIKAARTFTAEFFKAFSLLRRVGVPFKSGFVVYAGELETNFKDDRIVKYSSLEQIL